MVSHNSITDGNIIMLVFVIELKSVKWWGGGNNLTQEAPKKLAVIHVQVILIVNIYTLNIMHDIKIHYVSVLCSIADLCQGLWWKVHTSGYIAKTLIQ